MKLLRLHISILIAIISLSAYAQTGEQRYNLAIGVNGGINMSSVTFSPKVKHKNINGMTAGVTARYISERWFGMICGFQAELNYSQRGWDEYYPDYPDLQYTRTLNYLELPLLAHLGFGKDNKLQFFIHGGPQFGYYLSDSYTINGNWEDYSYHTAQHDMDVKHKLDYGIAAGGGFELPTKVGHFLVEGRYYMGLGDIFGNQKKDYFSRSANSGITIKLTYLFDITH